MPEIKVYSNGCRAIKQPNGLYKIISGPRRGYARVAPGGAGSGASAPRSRPKKGFHPKRKPKKGGSALGIVTDAIKYVHDNKDQIGEIADSFQPIVKDINDIFAGPENHRKMKADKEWEERTKRDPSLLKPLDISKFKKLDLDKQMEEYKRLYPDPRDGKGKKRRTHRKK